jgi:hypothetical protein
VPSHFLRGVVASEAARVTSFPTRIVGASCLASKRGLRDGRGRELARRGCCSSFKGEPDVSQRSPALGDSVGPAWLTAHSLITRSFKTGTQRAADGVNPRTDVYPLPPLNRRHTCPATALRDVCSDACLYSRARDRWFCGCLISWCVCFPLRKLRPKQARYRMRNATPVGGAARETAFKLKQRGALHLNCDEGLCKCASSQGLCGLLETVLDANI